MVEFKEGKLEIYKQECRTLSVGSKQLVGKQGKTSARLKITTAGAWIVRKPWNIPRAWGSLGTWRNSWCLEGSGRPGDPESRVADVTNQKGNCVVRV